MNKEKLDKLLADGTITQAVYDQLLGTEKDDKDKKPEDDKKPPEDEKKPDDDELEKKVQRLIDRATNKLGNENKDLREKLEQLKKEKMTDDEKKQYELEEKEKAILEREATLKAQENKLYAVKAIKKAGLDDGSDQSLELVDFVLADDEEGIDKRVKAFGALVTKMVKAQVDKTFKDRGGDPEKGGGGSGTPNPYKKETFNMTEQMQLELNNPELAKKFQAAAGYAV